MGLSGQFAWIDSRWMSQFKGYKLMKTLACLLTLNLNSNYKIVLQKNNHSNSNIELHVKSLHCISC